MSDHVAPQILMYYSGYASQQPISSTNAQVITVPMALKYVNGLSLQIKSFGPGSVDYAFQVCNQPLSKTFPEGNASPSIYRDESFGSSDWNTVIGGSGTLASASSDILVLDKCLFGFGRVTFKYNSGGSTNVAVFLYGAGA